MPFPHFYLSLFAYLIPSSFLFFLVCRLFLSSSSCYSVFFLLVISFFLSLIFFLPFVLSLSFLSIFVLSLSLRLFLCHISTGTNISENKSYLPGLQTNEIPTSHFL
jgi:hypothetical protein